jgi:hypothetical protein
LDYPVGTTVAAFSSYTPRNDSFGLKNDGAYGYAIAISGTLLTGTWRARGVWNDISAPQNYQLYTRTA